MSYKRLILRHCKEIQFCTNNGGIQSFLFDVKIFNIVILEIIFNIYYYKLKYYKYYKLLTL